MDFGKKQSKSHHFNSRIPRDVARFRIAYPSRVGPSLTYPLEVSVIRKASSILALSVLVASASAVQAEVAWDVPAGSLTHYDYSHGKTQTGKLGSPIALDGSFQFFPTDMKANSSNGTPSFAGDTASVVLNAVPTRQFSHITASVLGDYSILGVGNINSLGQLRVTNLDTSEVLWSNLVFTPAMPLFTQSSATGVFSANTSIAIPASWNNVNIDLDSSLSAFGDNGSTAFIEVKNASIGVETAVIPLPAAIAAAPLALIVAYRARRKMTRQA
jgi:hypothetical protein